MTKNKYQAIKKTPREDKFSCKRLTRKLSTLVLLTMSCLFTTPEKVSAGWQPETLQRISQLKVRVRKDCQFGTNATRLNSELQSYLKNKGIPIIRGEATNYNPYININIKCFISNGTLIVFKIDMEVIQFLNLKGKTIKAVTYDIDRYGVTPPRHFDEDEQKAVLTILNEFISDWRRIK